MLFRSLRSPGQPLDAATRAFFEPRFGHDFSQVRVHADDRAVRSAHALDAAAYTVGRDIVFGAGGYGAGDRRTRGMLAHELAHVAQQGAGGGPVVQRAPASSGTSTPVEIEEEEKEMAAAQTPEETASIAAGSARDRKSTRLNSSHITRSRMPSSA